MAGITNNMANLASVKLTADLTAAATTVAVDDATPYADLGDFYATLMPSNEMGRLSNSEIVLCTYASSTSLAITRAQRGTTAKSFSSGDILANGIYVQDLAQVQAVGNTIFDTTYSSGTYTVSSNNDMLPAMPTDGMRITIKVNANSSGTPKLDLQGLGASYNINTGTVINGSTTHNAASLKSGEIYELIFNGTSWEAKNIFSGTGTNGLIGSSDIVDSAITTNKIANSAVTNAKIGSAAVKSGNLDWSTLDTGWVDCNYTTGYKVSTNTGWKKLQARILNKVLYLRGGVSPSSGNFSTTEVNVAILPYDIKQTWLASDTSGNYPIEIGRAGGGANSTWTINPTLSGFIAVQCSASAAWAAVNLEYPI